MSLQNYPGQFPGNPWTRTLLPGATIVLAVFLAYLPALHGRFIWDDESWTLNLLPLFQNASGLSSIWFHPTVLQQYYPLSATTFWLDYQLWNFWPLPYHVENILLHALAALLFWRLLLRLQVPGAWLAAAVFALHPVMVESVAWITERKNVLSLVLYLSALLAYLRYAHSVAGGEWRVASGPPLQGSGAAGGGHASRVTRHASLFYALAFLLFLSALLAKTTAFSLPAVILLLAWWKRGRLRWRADVLSALPFFGLALGLCAVTAWLEKNHVGAQGADFALTLPQRCLIAGRVFWFYLGKLFWPTDFCFVYPRWQPNPGSGWQWLYPVTAIGGLFTLWLARGRIGRGPATALFFYVGTLFPVLGFMNAYFMRYSFVCDHWVYVSSLGFFALAAALLVGAAEKLRIPAVVYGFAVLVLPVLGVLTWHQTAIYRDMETLWRITLARNPGSGLAQSNLGALLLHTGRNTEAVEHYRRAVQINPDYASTYFNLGYALAKDGKFDEAMENFNRAIQIDPNDADAHLSLGILLGQSGRAREAVARYREALRLNPNLAEALNNLAWILATSSNDGLRNGAEAVRLAERACELTHHDKPLFLGTLAATYAEAGRFPEAVTAAELAEQLATKAGLTAIAAKNRQLLELYRAGKPYHESPSANPIPNPVTSTTMPSPSDDETCLGNVFPII